MHEGKWMANDPSAHSTGKRFDMIGRAENPPPTNRDTVTTFAAAGVAIHG
jgi:hypothetical protein